MRIRQKIKGLPLHEASSYLGNGAIAGNRLGIVTTAGVPDSQPVYLIDAETMQMLKKRNSTSDGNYLFRCLNPDKKYMVMVRDAQHRYRPFAWDWVTADTALNFDEQRELAESIFR